jgi:hypothetical protein
VFGAGFGPFVEGEDIEETRELGDRAFFQECQLWVKGAGVREKGRVGVKTRLCRTARGPGGNHNPPRIKIEGPSL